MVHFTTLSLKKDNYRVTVFSSQLIDLQVLFLHLDTAIMHPFYICVTLFLVNWCISLYFLELHNTAFYFLFNDIRND